jgi:hypothetical protein
MTVTTRRKNTKHPSVDIETLKGIFKQAIIEAMEEREDLVHDILVETMTQFSCSMLSIQFPCERSSLLMHHRGCSN